MKHLACLLVSNSDETLLWQGKRAFSLTKNSTLKLHQCHRRIWSLALFCKGPKDMRPTILNILAL